MFVQEKNYKYKNYIIFKNTAFLNSNLKCVVKSVSGTNTKSCMNESYPLTITG